MSVLTFRGGAHPPEFKSITESKAVSIIMPKKGAELLFPMSQHIGAPCDPLVEKGAEVLVGQKIGESGAFVTAPVHSSVSGVVKEIRDVVTPGGSVCKAVVVENDGELTDHPDINKGRDYNSMSKEQILAVIKEAGIVGMGGAGFPTHIKLNPPPEKKIDTLIINAAECEPYLTTDYRLMLEETDAFLEGIQIAMKLHPGAKAIIGIENNKPEAIALLEKRCQSLSNISVGVVQTKYPQGGEKQLIDSLMKREVPSGGLPADAGCIVNNVFTFVSIQRAVTLGRPVMHRVVTVAGGAIANPGNYQVRLGMTHQDLMDAIGGFKTTPYKLISGGPMMGAAMFSLDVPVIKTTSGFLAFTEQEAQMPPERNCIRCGKCIAQCPIHIMPQELNMNYLHGEWDLFRAGKGLDCIECGTCSYVCPANRHLTQSIHSTRKDMLAKKI